MCIRDRRRLAQLLQLQTEMVYLATTLTTSSCRVTVNAEHRCGMAICLESRGQSGVRVRVVTKASVGVRVTFYFATLLVIFHNSMQSHCTGAEWELLRSRLRSGG